jgi:hypothetical protein
MAVLRGSYLRIFSDRSVLGGGQNQRGWGLEYQSGSTLQKFREGRGFAPAVQFAPSRCLAGGREFAPGGTFLFDVLEIDTDLGAVVLDAPKHATDTRLTSPAYRALDPSIRWSDAGFTSRPGVGGIPGKPGLGPPEPEPQCPHGGLWPLCLEPPTIDPGSLCIGEIRWCKEETIIIIPSEVDVAISQSRAHTGRNSLLVRRDSPAFAQRVLDLHAEQSAGAPVRPRVYVLSAWVSRDQLDVPTFVDSAGSPSIEVLPWRGTDRPCLPDGPLIEGWQRIHCEFLVESNDVTTSLRFLSGAGTDKNATYFDDVRILPADASLETYVYDTRDLRMTAALDENNFSTQFGYDDDGALHLVRKETVRGLQTVNEYRSHLRERTRAVATHP